MVIFKHHGQDFYFHVIECRRLRRLSLSVPNGQLMSRWPGWGIFFTWDLTIVKGSNHEASKRPTVMGNHYEATKRPTEKICWVSNPVLLIIKWDTKYRPNTSPRIGIEPGRRDCKSKALTISLPRLIKTTTNILSKGKVALANKSI